MKNVAIFSYSFTVLSINIYIYIYIYLLTICEFDLVCFEILFVTSRNFGMSVS